MANLITEGFDWMPSGQPTATRARLWAANDFFATGSTFIPDVELGRFDFGKAALFNPSTNNNSGWVIPIGANLITGFIGCALKMYDDCSGAYGGPTIQVYDAIADAPQLTIVFCPNGVIKVFRGSNGRSGTAVLLANSAPGSFQENEWFHFEMKPIIDSAAGGIEIRINTVPKIQLVGANTQATSAAYFDSISLVTIANNNDHYHYSADDLFVNDTTGAEMNDWAGNLRVKSQFMIADGALDQFSIGGSSPAATHWQSVLNQLLDDSEYVYSPNVGDIDLYTPDPNLNAPLVRVVQIRMALRQDDATQRVARAVLRSAGANYEGSIDQYTNQTFTFYKDRWQLNPATGVTFTGAEVNAIQAGLKVQA